MVVHITKGEDKTSSVLCQDSFQIISFAKEYCVLLIMHPQKEANRVAHVLLNTLYLFISFTGNILPLHSFMIL